MLYWIFAIICLLPVFCAWFNYLIVRNILKLNQITFSESIGLGKHDRLSILFIPILNWIAFFCSFFLLYRKIRIVLGRDKIKTKLNILFSEVENQLLKDLK